jgi:hypothetical protein
VVAVAIAEHIERWIEQDATSPESISASRAAAP